VWLSYTVAAGYAVLLTLAMTYSRRVLPPGGEVHLIVWPFVLAVILSGFLAGAFQAVLVAGAGLTFRLLLSWLRMRLSDASAAHRAV
jgi:hypothetical protein